MLSTLRDHVPSVRRALRRRRRSLTLLAALAAAALLLPGLLPAPADEVTVVVAHRDLRAGQEITPADLTTLEVRSTAEDPPLQDPAAALGRRPALDVPAGAALHPWMLTSPEHDSIPDGWVLMAVTVDPALAPFLRSGVRIGLVVPNTTAARDGRTEVDRSTSTIEGIVVTPLKAQVKDLQNIADGSSGDSRAIVAVPAQVAGDLSHSAAQSLLSVYVVDYPRSGGNTP